MKISKDLWKLIFSNVDADTLLCICCVNKQFNNLVGKDLWKHVVQKEQSKKLFQCLEYADAFVENVYKKFVLTNTTKRPKKSIYEKFKNGLFKGLKGIFVGEEKYSVPENPRLLVLNLSKKFGANIAFQLRGKYKIWTLDTFDTLDFILIELINSENPDNTVITHYAGYINKSAPQDRGMVITRDYVYIGMFKNGDFHGYGEFFSKKDVNSPSLCICTFKHGKTIGNHTIEENDQFTIYTGHGTERIQCYKQGGYLEISKCTEFGDNYYHDLVFMSKKGFKLEGKSLNYEYCGEIKITDYSGHSFYTNFTNGEIDEKFHIFKQKLNPSIIKCVEIGLCTKAYTKKHYYPQYYYDCETCNVSKDSNLGFCSVCIIKCHLEKGHKVSNKPKLSHEFFCDCSSKGLCFCYERNKDYSDLFPNMVEPIVVYHKQHPKEYHLQTYIDKFC